MKNMLRSFLSFLIAFSLIGTSASQAFTQMTKHSIGGNITEITICSADQPAKTILIDQNGNQVPEPVKCDCPACPNCLNTSVFNLPDAVRAIGHERTVLLINIPQPFDLADAFTNASVTARAPPHKV
ncbi:MULTISPECIES: hypothetical protein [Thalassospira]|uniref:DUF2946 domain-containing protein n=2 Tax=Thalassospira TaxID=168934 RepID=A0A367WAI9_9PROT|nr:MULTISPECIES: hypothetical protein [Thalassospira]MDG4720418.1 hypothetical protein [Thalassospira sp. FZY0004]RCK37601.1 hypothetical protein TH19_10140 [Thalassospira profundimaris]